MKKWLLLFSTGKHGDLSLKDQVTHQSHTAGKVALDSVQGGLPDKVLHEMYIINTTHCLSEIQI